MFKLLKRLIGIILNKKDCCYYMNSNNILPPPLEEPLEHELLEKVGNNDIDPIELYFGVNCEDWTIVITNDQPDSLGMYLEIAYFGEKQFLTPAFCTTSPLWTLLTLTTCIVGCDQRYARWIGGRFLKKATEKLLICFALAVANSSTNQNLK